MMQLYQAEIFYDRNAKASAKLMKEAKELGLNTINLSGKSIIEGRAELEKTIFSYLTS